MKKLCIKILILLTTVQSYCGIEKLRQIYWEITSCTTPEKDREAIVELRQKIAGIERGENENNHHVCVLLIQLCDEKEELFNYQETLRTASRDDKAGLLLTCPQGSLFLQKEIEKELK